jgi:hypothetical protein
MNSTRRTRLITTGLGIAATLLSVSANAVATGNVPRTPGLNRTKPLWLGYAVMALMLVATVLASLLPSKRGHQD